MRPQPPTQGRSARRVVAASRAQYDELWVVCDDGAVFAFDQHDQEWEEHAPVPGTLRARQKERVR
jgi:hypothetical protein